MKGKSPAEEEKKSWRKQLAALRYLPPFPRLIWHTGPSLAFWNAAPRVVKAAVPLAMLYIGKEIIDTVLAILENPEASRSYLWLMVGLELGLALFNDLLNRGIRTRLATTNPDLEVFCPLQNCSRGPAGRFKDRRMRATGNDRKG